MNTAVITRQFRELIQQLSWVLDISDLKAQGLTEEEILIIIEQASDDYWNSYYIPDEQ